MNDDKPLSGWALAIFWALAFGFCAVFLLTCAVGLGALVGYFNR